MSRLFIRFLSPALPSEESYQVRSEWAIIEDGGGVRASGETDFRGLSDLIDPTSDWLSKPNNIIVIIPNDFVLCVSCSVPGRNVGQIRRALPFVVEEFVTTDIDHMHLASGELKRGAPVRCNLIERTLLDNWLNCLEQLGIRPGYMIAEAELLPVSAGQMTLLLDDAEAVIRTTDEAASVDRENLLLALGALEANSLQVVYGDLTDIERGQLGPEIEVDKLRLPDGDPETRLLYLAAAWRQGEPAINLLQGRYQAKQPINPTWLSWRPAAALAAMWLLIAVVGMAVQAIYAGYRADQLEASSEALYREIFPGERRVTNVRRQMQARLGDRSGGADSGFIAQLAALGIELEPSTGVMGLSYTEDRGELAADLLIPGYEELDRLKQRLGSEGFGVEITSAEQQEKGVRARLRISDQQGGQGA